MKIHYVILAHKNPAQLRRLVRALDDKNVAFHIHVDKKTDLADFQPLAGDNVRLTDRRVKVYWGGYSQVQATLNLLDDIKGIADRDFVVYLSGSDYPIKSPSHIKDFLRGNADRSFMPGGSLANWPEAAARYDHHHFERAFLGKKGHYLRRAYRAVTPRRRFIDGFEPYGGSAYWALSGEAVRFVKESLRRRPEFISFFKRTASPDEMFFHTLLFNSPLRDKLISNGLHHIKWAPGSDHPATLRAREIDELLGSDKLFARKFDPEVDSKVLDLLDRRVLKKN